MKKVHTVEIYLTVRSPKEVYTKARKIKIQNCEHPYGSNITISNDYNDEFTIFNLNIIYIIILNVCLFVCLSVCQVKTAQSLVTFSFRLLVHWKLLILAVVIGYISSSYV